MKNTIVRLQSITIDNLQNVLHGSIEMPNNYTGNYFATTADVLGIYGQNGSGKTAVIHALALLKAVLMGQVINNDEVNFITYGKKESSYVFEFLLSGERIYKAIYSFTIKKEKTTDENNEVSTRAILSEESLKIAEFTEAKWGPLRVAMSTVLDDDGSVLAPGKTLKLLYKNEKELNEIRAQKTVAKIRGTSFFFAGDFQRHLTHYEEKVAVAKVLKDLNMYGLRYLYVINNMGWGSINMNMGLPFYFRVSSKQNIYSMGTIILNLMGSTALTKDMVAIIRKAITELDIVLRCLIPDMSVVLKELGEDVLPDGSKGIRVSLFSQRNGIELPLRYESEGVKKIVAILQILITAYNDPSMTLAVDELDASIFEYLLGEILDIFASNGSGQLIFTSHNLRPLEKLNKSSVVFTTVNPKNRYMRLKNVKTNNNLRDFYYRAIILGGQKEELYKKTNNYEITRAFWKAGESNG